MNREPDLEHLRELGLAQQVKDVDSGDQYYRLNSGVIQEYKQLLQDDDQMALIVFGLYFKTVKRNTEKSMPVIMEDIAVVFRDTCNRNILRTIADTDDENLKAWRRWVEKLDGEYVETFDP